MRSHIACSLLLLLIMTAPAFPVMKQHYGGNLRVAEELLSGISSTRLFQADQEMLIPKLPLPYQIEETRLTIQLAALPPDRVTELERSVQSLYNESNPCHWILDYPNFTHRHATSITVDKERYILETEEPEYLQLIAQSECLVPESISYLLSFRKTQFGYEANTKNLMGRPFLDSISPVAVDPQNPYLTFKLNETDAFLVPEDKYQQISSDDQIRLLPGPQSYVYLKTENLSAPQVLSLLSVLDAREIARVLLNGHAQIFLPEKESGTAQIFKTPIDLKVPEEPPFRLIGDRIRVQLQNAGFGINTKAATKTDPLLEVAVAAVREQDLDLFRFRLLREDLQIYSDAAWFEEWDELESSGKIVPVLLYESRIAVRKNLIDVDSGPGGLPDFSNAWILPDNMAEK